LRERIAALQAEAVIPSKRSRTLTLAHAIDVSKHRNRIERCCNRLQPFRRLAPRYARRTSHFTGFVHRAAARIWLR
jgi:transposase